MDVIYRSNTNVVEVPSLTNGLTDALVSGATVTCTIVTATGAQVVGATGFAWPVSLSAATGATGTYRGVLPHTRRDRPVRFLARAGARGDEDVT